MLALWLKSENDLVAYAEVKKKRKAKLNYLTLILVYIRLINNGIS